MLIAFGLQLYFEVFENCGEVELLSQLCEVDPVRHSMCVVMVLLSLTILNHTYSPR